MMERNKKLNIISLFLFLAAVFSEKVPFQFGIAKMLTPKVEPTHIKPGLYLWSQDNELNLEWAPLDDVVMGGVSESKILTGSSFKGDWEGIVTTANSGGFAGIRSKTLTTPLDMSSCRGFLIKVKGDGKRYKFISRDDDQWNGIAWSYSFDTVNDKIIEVKVPFSQLIPTKFARSVSIPKGFDSSKVYAFQFTLSKFEYDGGLNPKFSEGPFKMQIQSIKSF